jgi:hypothetical protein
VKPFAPQHEAMFGLDEPFQFGEVWDFTGEKFTKASRADEALQLPDFQQCQLVALQGTAVPLSGLSYRATKSGLHNRYFLTVFRLRPELSAICRMERLSRSCQFRIFLIRAVVIMTSTSLAASITPRRQEFNQFNDSSIRIM